MQTKQVLKGSLAAAATLSLMVACGPAPTSPSPSPSASASASAEPSAAPTTDPSVAPTTEPTAAPTTAPTANPSATATPTPLPSATDDISVVEKTTFNGKVFDDTQAPLEGVTITAKSLNSSVPFEATTTTAGGTYAFNNAPAGIQIEILASKPGFTTRKRVEVLKSNKQGDPNANKYDFGQDPSGNGSGSANNALSDKPEVTKVVPGRSASGVDPKTSFVLTFSEPMDKKTVEDTFTIRSHNDRKFTVDAGNTRAGDQNTVKGNNSSDFTSAAAITAGSDIWDKDAFNISWNSNDTEATFSFKEEKLLPTDKDSNLTPDYQVAFKAFSGGDRILKDKSGISRNEKHFKLTDGNFEEYYKFSINTDTTAPTLTSITAQTDENAGSNGDAVSVRYSERMIIYTRSRTIAGGMENVTGAEQKAPGAYPVANAVANSRDVAKNYKATVVNGTNTKYSGTWWALGGTAVYDTTDVTHKTVLLLPPTNAGTITAAAVSGTQQASIHVTYTDGTTETFNTANATATIQFAQLQTLLNNAVNIFTVSAVSDGGGANNIDANDSYTISVNAGATGTGGKAIAAVWIPATGLFANTVLSKATAPMYFVPGGTPGTKGNLYAAGETVRIEISNTVVDPAGNTIDSSRDDSSANAS